MRHTSSRTMHNIIITVMMFALIVLAYVIKVVMDDIRETNEATWLYVETPTGLRAALIGCRGARVVTLDVGYNIKCRQ